MRRRTMWWATAVVGSALAGQAVAQQPAPTLTVTASTSSVALSSTGPVAAGPTRLDVVRAPGSKDVDVYVALLVPGVSLQQALASLATSDRGGSDASLGLVSVQASTVLTGKETHRALTFTVKPGLTYYVLSEADADSRGKVKPRGMATFTSAATSNGAAPPAPAATVRMEGLRFKGSATLPQKGTVRFENRDGTAHFALAFPLRKGTTRAQLGRAVHSRSNREFNRIAAGRPYMAQNVISGGDTTNDQELTFATKGTYGLLCFIDGHADLGMYRVVTVR